MKTVVYTCITGGYDCLKEVPKQFMDKDLDFVCYTDDPNLKSETWKIRMVPEQLDRLSPVKRQRIVKVCPTKFLPEYEASLWIDGSMEIVGSVKKFLEKCDLRKYPLWTIRHPQRNCLYAEEKAVLDMRKDRSEITGPQMRRYLSEKFPRNYGLAETRAIYRSHTDEKCRQTMLLWANEILRGSHRDQLSFNYCCWKKGLKYGEFDKETLGGTFKWFAKHPTENNKSEKVVEKISENCLKTTESRETSVGKVDSVDIYTVNFNHSELTNAWIKSVLKNVSGIDYRIFVVDNSDQTPFVLDESIDKSLVTVIDNTDDKVIPVKFAVKYFSYIPIKANANGSYKHALTIQWILDNCSNNNLLLFDCDTILKRNIDFLDQKYVTVAEVQTYQPKGSRTRFKPMLQYFNLNSIKQHKLRYFYGERIHGGMSSSGNYYDTGASFYEDIIKLKLPFKPINYTDYIDHFKSGTWKNLESIPSFLLATKIYWDSDMNSKISENVKTYNESNISKCRHKFTRDPKTLQDKLVWLNIYDIPWSSKYNKPLKSVCADKLLVKEYAKEKIGKELGVKTLFAYHSPSEIEWEKLPKKFVVKVNHNSGGTIVCNDKSKLNQKECVDRIKKWLSTDFTFQNGFESHYHWIERKIFVEEFLEDEDQKDSLIDYKFWCFNGDPKFFTINSGNGHGAINHYDLTGKLLDLSRSDYPSDKFKKWKMPKNLSKMIEYAKKLSEDFKFVRIDFYEVNEKIYLGELTFTPGNCTFKYNGNYDQVLGDMLQI